MEKVVIVLLVACGSVLCHCTASKQIQSSSSRSHTIVDSLKARLPLLMQEADIPGLSVALIQEGSLYWTGSFGVTSTKTGTPVTDSTVFEAASLSKPVFAYAVLMLAERGVIDLHKPLVQYLPPTMSFTDPAISRITAAMVMSHRTGLPNWRRGDTLKTYFEPGERFSYSGEATNLLQKAVEEIYKKPLDALMQELVFGPLQMTQSSFSWQPSFDRLKAYPHNDRQQPGNRNKPLEAGAASTLHTTAADYGRFLSAVLRGEGIRKKSFRQMITPQSQIDENCVNCLEKSKSPSISKNIFWGLGWGLQQTKEGTALWHWGDNGAFKAYVIGLPDRKDGVVFFANSIQGLSITDDVVQMALRVSQPASKWLAYEPYNTPARKLLRQIISGKEEVIQQLKKNLLTNTLTIREDNWIAQQLLNRKMNAEAIALYDVSLAKEPGNYAALVGIALAYEKLSDRQAALRYLKAAQAKRPEENELADAISRLEKPAFYVEAKTLDSYQGRYDSPIGKLNLTVENGILYAELEGQSKEELTPVSEARFYAMDVKAYFTLSGGSNGGPGTMLIEVGGQKITANKLL